MVLYLSAGQLMTVILLLDKLECIWMSAKMIKDF